MEKEITNTTSTETTKLITSSNIWEDVKERLSAPFFASFIISWIICNWKIIVVLFWFGKDVDGPTGATTRIELIYKYSSHWRTMWLPFVLAIAYCWLYPAFKAFSDWLVAHIKTHASGKILKASGKAKVGMSVFLDLKTQYDKANKTLEKEIEASSAFQAEKAEFQQKINELNRNVNEKTGLLKDALFEKQNFETQLSDFEKSLRVSSFLGKYEVRFHALNEDIGENLDNYAEIEIYISSTNESVLKFEYNNNNISYEHYIIDILTNKDKNYTTFLLSNRPSIEEDISMILVINRLSNTQSFYEGVITKVDYVDHAFLTKI